MLDVFMRCCSIEHSREDRRNLGLNYPLNYQILCNGGHTRRALLERDLYLREREREKTFRRETFV